MDEAIRNAGVEEEVKKIAIPMSGRIMHDMDGKLTYQPYGKKDEAIYSVSRGHLNAIVMDIAETKEGLRYIIIINALGQI